MPKSKDAFRTISEVAEWLDTQPHVLRFWESKFTQVRPVKRAGGRRYYRPVDMLLLGGIKSLLHDDGMTIKGVQKLLREKGVKEISALSRALDDEPDDTVVAASAETQPVETQSAPPAPEPAVAAENTPEDTETSVGLAETEAQQPSEDVAEDIEATVAEAVAAEAEADTSLDVEDEADDALDDFAPANETDAPATDVKLATPTKPNTPENGAWRIRRKLIARLIEIDHIPARDKPAVAQAVSALKAIRAKSNEAHLG